jgi:hypothetical protein
MNINEIHYLNNYGLVLKGGILASLEELIDNRKNKIKNISYKEKRGIEYIWDNNEQHFLFTGYFIDFIKKYNTIFPEYLLKINNSKELINEINKIRKEIDLKYYINDNWENLIYINLNIFNKKRILKYNIYVIKNYLKRYAILDIDIEKMVNDAFYRFLYRPYMKDYVLPTIERYNYWKKLHYGNLSFHDAYKNYKN